MADFIYNQKKIPRKQWRYGLRSSASVGCGWIATHNVLHLLGYEENIEDLISYYEHQLPLIHGNLGTSFWAPAFCFRHWGFPADLVFDRRKFDAAARNAPASVLFYHWRKGAKLGAHFVAVRYNGSQFIGFNTFRTSHGPDPLGDSLEAFLKQKHYFGAVLIPVGHRAQEPSFGSLHKK